MSSSNYCFLTCMQIFQGSCQVVWYSHLFNNFPQFVVIHTVKVFGIVNKAVEVFFGTLAFLMIQWMLVIWSLVSLPFLKPAWTSGSSRFMYCWSLAWRILSITLLACEMSAIVWKFEHSLALLFFGIGMITDFFQSCGHCWVFQFCWHIECSTFTASSLSLILGNCSHTLESPGLSLKHRFWFIRSRMNLRFFNSHRLQVMLLLPILLTTPWQARSEIVGTKHLRYCLPHQKIQKTLTLSALLQSYWL